uniref:hypothetical protein n=1 Tax=Pararhizobium sp. IMCC3301 TaxID=3067904 RepID=UPI0027418C51|nr:hypothetical protein [Pararhizobium sp. IMCC3301]
MIMIKQTAQLLLRIVAALVSLVVLVGAGVLALGMLTLATLAIVLRVKWLQHKFSRQPDARIINAEKTKNGGYSISGL